MSKVKTNRLEPRSEDGTLTIGTPNGAVMFEGDVNIPQYATTEWVVDIITEDIAPELQHYQKRDEKDKAHGYAGLNANAKVDASYLDTTAIEQNINTIETNIISIEGEVNANTDAISKIDPGEFVHKSGDTMSGDLDMSGQRVKDIPQVPLEDTDAASKYYVDNASEVLNHNVEINGSASNSQAILNIKNYSTSYFKFMGDRDLVLTGGQIKGVAEPNLDTDVATKSYVDSVGERGIQGPVKIHSDYVGTAEVVFGVYEELTLAQATEKGHDLSLGVPKEPRDGVPYSEYALFRVMGDGKLWAFNSLKGLSAAPGANQDATNKEYVDSKVSSMAADFVDRILLLEQKIATLESQL